MSTPRRRIVRPVALPAPADHRLHKLRSKLDAERSALTRWMSRLRRAFHAVEKAQGRIRRIERQIQRREVT